MSRNYLALVLLSVIVNSRLWAENFTLAPDPIGDPVKTELTKDKPWVPGWCRWDWRAGWVSQHNAHLERTKKGDIDIVFLGDSITQGWSSEGKEVWEKFYASLKAVNYGIGGDSTRQILYRVEHGNLDGIHPKVIIIKIGTNNLYGDANAGTDEEIAKGIEAVVELVQSKQADAKILLLAILPRQNEFFCGRVKKINELISKLADGDKVRFLDMGPKFQESFGKVKPDLYNKDQLHLVKKGYEVWAETMKPVLDELLK